MIEVEATGLVYRNPKPHLRAVNAWHPTLARLDDRTMLAAFDLGQGPESLDYATYLARSEDGGSTWSEPDALTPQLPLLLEDSDAVPAVCNHPICSAQHGPSHPA